MADMSFCYALAFSLRLRHFSPHETAFTFCQVFLPLDIKNAGLHPCRASATMNKKICAAQPAVFSPPREPPAYFSDIFQGSLSPL